MSRLRAFVLLAGDALRDALRTRIGIGVLLLAVLLVLGTDRCAGAQPDTFTWNGRELPAALAGTVFGPLLFVTLAFVLVGAAALVASDSLSRPVEDGTAALWLSRPVSRTTYVLSRLAGGLLLVLLAAIPVLGFATAVVARRFELAWQTGLVGYATFAADALVVSAVAMLLSLHLPRMLTLFGVFLWLQYLVVSNAMHVVGTIVEGGGRLLEGFGPPLGTALLFAVAPWARLEPPAGEAAIAGARLALWAAGALALLVLSFRRRDLR